MAELTKLGRYQLRRVLGRGAMGVVYEGFDPTLGRRVAVKTILKGATLDEETERAYSERFVKEAKAVGRLNHPHIVQVHDFGEENEIAYLVMEFIQGRELRSFFAARERFEPAETVRIMGELLDALEFAHEAGVVHRDVKPANVMLDGQRRVKLADFGVARVLDGAEQSMAGTMVGTPAFMSPEQISGGKIDRRTDIFSAGVVLYQLLTGEQPFTGEGAWTVAKKIMESHPPSPSSVLRSVSPAYDAIVDKALAKTPAQRFASAKEFAGALRGVLGGAAPAVAAATPPVPKAKAKPDARASEAEVEFWRSIQNSTDPDEIDFYLEQFPDGTYAQLARHKVAKLREPIEAERRAAEQKARQEEEEKARRESEEKAKRDALENAKREAAEKAKREAEERARRVAEEKARRDAEEKAKREAAEKAKRDAEEKIRQAQALSRLKQQEEAAAQARAAADEDATVAIGIPRSAASPPTPAQRKTPYAIPVVGVVVVIAVGIGAYLLLGRSNAPEPVVQVAALPKVEAPAPAAAPQKAEISTADVEKIRKETEERIRREYADKSAAEQAAAAKAVAEKAVQEKQLALKAAAEKAAADKAASEKAALEKATAAKSAAERVAAEKAAAEKAAAEKIAADKAAAEKAAADKLAAEKVAAAKAAAAAKPGWPSVGDRWTYRAVIKDKAGSARDIVIDVQRVTENSIVEQARIGSTLAGTGTHTAGAYLIAGTGLPVPEFSPHLRAFGSLKVGDRWNTVATRQIAMCNIPEVSCSASGRVIGEEKVTVPAGTFDAVKIEIEFLARNTSAQAVWSFGFRLAIATHTIWYSERAGRAVKIQSRGDIKATDPFDIELLSFKRN